MSRAKNLELSADCEEADARLAVAVQERLQCVLLIGGSAERRDRVLRAFTAERRSEAMATASLDLTSDDILHDLAQRLPSLRCVRADHRTILREWNLLLAALELERSLLCLTAKVDSPLTAEEWERTAQLFARSGTVLLVVSAEHRRFLPPCALAAIDLIAELEEVVSSHPRAVDLPSGLASLAAAEAMHAR